MAQRRWSDDIPTVLPVRALFFLLILIAGDPCSAKIESPPASVATIDNELVGDPIVDCEETMISVMFKTKKPFNGRVYVQGMADDDRCSRNFASNSDQSKFSMMIQNGDCTMQRQRVTGSLEGVMLSLTIVVSFHGTFVTRSDRAYRCMCFFKSVKHLTSAIDVNLIGTTELLDTAKTPSCQYSIHTQSPDGPPVALGKVGDKIFHVWECDDPSHGFLVHSCSVDDGKGAKFDLLDIDGCAIDPIIQPDVFYDERNNRASVETFGYKFSDTTVLNYQCTIELCKRSTDECLGLSPPICGRHKRDSEAAAALGHGRQTRRRSINATALPDSAVQIDLLTSLKVLDNIYADVIDDDDAKAIDVGDDAARPPINASPATTPSTRTRSMMMLSKSVQLMRALKPFVGGATSIGGGDVPSIGVSRDDCLRSMVLGFTITLFAAIAFIVGAVFIVLRRESVAKLL